MDILDFDGLFELELVLLKLIKHFSQFSFKLEHLQLELCRLSIRISIRRGILWISCINRVHPLQSINLHSNITLLPVLHFPLACFNFKLPNNITRRVQLIKLRPNGNQVLNHRQTLLLIELITLLP